MLFERQTAEDWWEWQQRFCEVLLGQLGWIARTSDGETSLDADRHLKRHPYKGETDLTKVYVCQLQSGPLDNRKVTTRPESVTAVCHALWNGVKLRWRRGRRFSSALSW